MISGAIDNWRVAWTLAAREAKARYSGSIADIAWIILGPCIYALVFLLLRAQLSKMGVEVSTGGINPVVYAFTGVVLWQVWFETLLRQVDFFKSGKSFLRSRPIAPSVFFYAQFAVSLSDLAVRLVLIAAASFLFRQNLGDLWFAAPLAALALIFSANILGLLLAVPGSFLSDVAKTLQSISLGLFIVSPVFYAVPADPSSPLHYFTQFNPFGTLLVNFHAVTFGTQPLMVTPALAWLGGLALLLPVLLAYFRKVAPLIVERL